MIIQKNTPHDEEDTKNDSILQCVQREDGLGWCLDPGFGFSDHKRAFKTQYKKC